MSLDSCHELAPGRQLFLGELLAPDEAEGMPPEDMEGPAAILVVTD